MKFIIGLIIFLLIFSTACYYDNEEDLYPVSLNTCDTINVTYNGTIVPLLNNHCLSCHSNILAPSLGGNIPLENYNDVKETAIEGSLYGSISYNPDYSSMPIDYKLDECTIKKVKIWIENGAKND
ncbi:MAG: hypothetical protein KAT68_12200 [Bacteroidales bacterium]|nr:hypothetical protein [Bacteroidales bacterium]